MNALPKGQRFFRKEIAWPSDAEVEWAYLLIAADDGFRLFLNGKLQSRSRDEADGWKQGYEVELTGKLRTNEEANVLAILVSNAKEGPAGVAGKLVARLSNGEDFVIPIDDSWKASSKGDKGWNQTGFDDSAWSMARTIAAVGEKPWGMPGGRGYEVGWMQKSPSPMLRKSFELSQPVKRATVYVAGLGYYELHLNGEKVGDHVLDPAFTRYDRRILYSTYDVTEQVTQGENALGVMLGNGWYNMHTRATWNFDQAPWRDEPRTIIHLRLEMADGSVRTIVTDGTWKAKAGPVWLDGVRAGEVYDARKEIPDWSRGGFADEEWVAASVVGAPSGRLSALMMPPIRVTDTLKPVEMRETRPGVFLYDLGQNISGWARLRLEGLRGTKIKLRYSERIREDGTLDRENISKFHFAGPFQQDTYILKGGGLEVWEPRFTYHGFQYVEVSVSSGEIGRLDVEGRMVNTDFDKAGEFRCSNELFNRIQELGDWSFRGNYHGYPTDCPQREKNGWTGDAHLAAEQALFNWDVASAYAKWIDDIRDEQRDSGEIAAIIPTSGWGYAWGNGPAWDSAFLLIPWYIYQYRGDLQILEENYESMRRYVDYVASRSQGYIANFGLGDWAPAETVTPRDITSTGYFYVDASIMAQTAALLGHDADAAKYRELAENIRVAFNKKFYNGDGTYANGSQTALSCALYQEMADPAERSRIVDRLVIEVHRKNDHLDVGILGAKYLFNTLSDHGQHELAYRIANQTTAPSYGHWVAQGATTMWERWNGESSRNHIMCGDICAWMYKYLAGIRVDPRQPGFKNVIIQPDPVGNMTWVKAHHDSLYGRIVSQWKREGKGFTMTVTIPPNSTGTISVPTTAPSSVQINGESVKNIDFIDFVKQESGRAVFRADSGTYTFTSNIDE
jgi:alpha-L-rhamnosidase